nr:hypothetical protein [Tanacetum cinerariifolium]
MLVHQGEGSGTPTEPHRIPSPEADTLHPTTLSIPLPSLPTAPIPPVTQTNTTPIRQYSRRARIAQSSALLTVADEHASSVRDVSEWEACPTESGFIADQDKATIAKSSTLPHDSAPRVTSPAADEGSMQQTISELTALCSSLQRQHSELLAKFQAQEVEILRLKKRVQVLEDRESVAAKQSGDDALIKGRSINEGEAAAERISDDSEELARVLTSMDAATVLARGIDVPTGSGSIPTAGSPAADISTGSEVVPTASLIVTSYSRRKGKEVMVESDTLKKQRLQEQIDAQVTKELEEQQEKEDMIMNEQIARDAEVSQQRRPMTKKQKRDYYMTMIRNNLGWKVKDFKGMTFEEIEAKFASVWKHVEDFIPIGSKEEAERLKRKGFNLEQEHSEHNINFHPMVDFIEASPLRIATTEEGTQILATVDGIHRTVTESSLRRNLKLKDKEGIRFNEFSSNIATALICLDTNRTYNFSKMIFDGLVKNVNNKGEGSGTPTEPHHTPSLEAQPSSPTTHSSPTLPPVITTFIPVVPLSETTPIRHYTRRARIAQSSGLLIVVDEPDSPVRDVSQGEACPTDFGFIADQDRATIAKSSTLPHDSTPMVTSPAADEDSMQQTISKLTALCTSLQRQHSELHAKFQAQEVEINRMKERVKLLEDRDGVAAQRSRDDALIKGKSVDEGEAVAERISDDLEEMATVLTSMDVAIVLAEGIADVPTGSGSFPTASPPADAVPTGSDVVPTASLVFATATMIDDQVARELEEQLERKDQRRSEQIARDAEIAKIHAEEELQIMIDGLDRNNEIVAKYLQECHQLASELPIERRIELIIWKQLEDFIPMGSKEEAERIKRKGLSLEQESAKKQKISEEVTEEAKTPDEVSKEKDKEIFMLVEKDYPLRKGLALVMISYKLQVENYSQMANDLILKIYKIPNSPR